MDTGEPPKAERLEDWVQDLVTHIGRRAAIMYAMNEIAKATTKSYFTEAAKDLLKDWQRAENKEIQRVMFLLINGHK